MEEKVLRKNKNGMAVLILGIILYLIAAALIVFGSVWMAEEEMVLGVILFVVGTVDPVSRIEGIEAPGGVGADAVWKICGHPEGAWLLSCESVLYRGKSGGTHEAKPER